MNFRHSNKAKPFILFFVAGMVPTSAEVTDAATYGPVAFRNASFINPTDAIEPNDGVAGLVPKSYRDAKCIMAPRLSRPIAENPNVVNPVPNPGRAKETGMGSWGTKK